MNTYKCYIECVDVTMLWYMTSLNIYIYRVSSVFADTTRHILRTTFGIAFEGRNKRKVNLYCSCLVLPGLFMYSIDCT